MEETYIKIGEHEYKLPPQPPKSEIFFSNLPKSEQYWRRERYKDEYPAIFYEWYHPYMDGKNSVQVELDAAHTMYDSSGKILTALSKEDTDLLISIVAREKKRMHEGVWFMNNGKPVYLTGRHYGIMQWMAFLDSQNAIDRTKYPQYMQLQRNVAYFLEIIKHDTVAVGGTLVKPKKTGITQFVAAWTLVDALCTANKLYRMMSTTEIECKDSCFNYIAYSLENLPAILTPLISKQNMGEVKFGRPDASKGKRNKRIDNDVSYMNTEIMTVATGTRSFDLRTNRIAWIDEHSKINSVDLKLLHNSTKATVVMGGLKLGFALYTGYTAEDDGPAFKDSRTIYYESQLRTIDPATGQTKSGFLCYALTVLDGVFGFTDKYGNPETREITKRDREERHRLRNDPQALQAWKRQQPMSENDCWDLGVGITSTFDNVRLGIKYQEIELDENVNVYPYFRFNFKWRKEPIVRPAEKFYKFENGLDIVRLTDEDIKARKLGVFKWFREEYMPQWWLQPRVNRVVKHKNGLWAPAPDSAFYASMDPTGMADKKDVELGSQTAIQVFVLPDMQLNAAIGKNVTNCRPFVTYLYRADNPKDSLMHIIQVIMYFGCYVLVEANQAWVYTELKHYGFENFLIVQGKEGIPEPYKRNNTDQKPYTTQKDASSAYVNIGRVHLGKTEAESDIDNIEYIDDKDILDDLMKFNKDDTKKFDAGICYLVGLVGISAFLGWLENQKRKSSTEGKEMMRAVFGLKLQEKW